MYSLLLSKIAGNQVIESEDGNHVKLNLDCDIFVWSDSHIDYKKERPQYFWEIMRYYDRLIEMMRWSTNPVFISLGDIYDKDLNLNKGLLYFEETLKRFKTIEKITQGRCYMVFGNHESTYLEINPSALIMKPSNYLLELMGLNKQKEINRTFGSILKTPVDIRAYDTKLTLFHFNKHNKYYTTIGGDCEFHIGLFHDTYVNNTMREKINGALPVDLIWKNSMKNLDLNYIDLAIFGDFHIPVPLFRINNRRNTAIIIPGSSGRNNISVETHNSIKLPIIEIRKDKKPKIKVTDFMLDDFTLSYNLSDKLKKISDISNRLKRLTGDIKHYKKQEINLENFSSFIYSAYGEEWGFKVYKFIRDNLGVEVNPKSEEDTNGRDTGIEEEII